MNNLEKAIEVENILESRGYYLVLRDGLEDVWIVKNNRKVTVNLAKELYRPIQGILSMIEGMFERGEFDFSPFDYDTAMSIIKGRSLVVTREAWFPNNMAIAYRNGNYVKMTKHWTTEYTETHDDVNHEDWVLADRNMVL